MKKLIIIIAVTLMAASANAQLYKSFGIKGGISIAKQVGTLGDYDVTNTLYKTGITLGIFKEFSLIQNLKAQVGINYVKKGTISQVIPYSSPETTVNYVLNINFITTEVYAKYDFLSSNIKPYALAGLRLDFYVSQNNYIENGEEVSPRTNSITNNKIFGTSLGAGIEYQATKLFSVFLEGTYNPDFTDIHDEISQMHGQSFDIRTGIKFCK